MGPGNRPLDMEWLEDFLALAESGNFSRAAQARAIAQPAFSRHIRSLEEWVGVDLFDRSEHPVELTAAGKRFRPLLQDVLANLEAARIKSRLAHDEAASSLRFAATHVLSVYFFPRWLVSMEGRLRLGPVQTMSDSSRACEDLMLQRRVQFVLCYGHADVPGRLDEAGYPVLHLADDLLVPVSAPDAQGQPLHAIERGGPLPVLGYSDASGLGRIMAGRLRAAFGGGGAGTPIPDLSVVFTAHNAILLKTLALDGRGLAWLPRSLVADELSSGRLVEGGDAAWQVPLEIRLYRQRAEMAAVAEALWTQAAGG
jgi:LysR family transcriptional regulator, hypochlorite-specific transcription factor HypT